MNGPFAGGEIDAIMDRDAVVLDFDASNLLVGFGIDRLGFPLDIISLPRQRRIAHVDLGLFAAIKAAAFVVLAFEAEAVEDLNLVLAMEINAAVAATLVTCRRLERRAKFE